MPTAAVSVTTSATKILAARYTEPGRIGVVLDNQGSVTVFLGDDDTVTTANGITLEAGKKFILTAEMGFEKYFFRGDLYGIVASGTADVRAWELRYS